MSAEAPARVFLVGMMGAGKTTTGTTLARRLGWQLLDSDAEVVRRRGKTVAEIWRDEGEPFFRVEESAVLAEAARHGDPVVVAVAGGALLSEQSRRLVVGAGTVIWLRVPMSVLAARVGSGEGRPLLEAPLMAEAGSSQDDAAESGPRHALERLYRSREQTYEEVADLVIDVGERGPNEVVDSIIAALVAFGVDVGQAADA